MEMGAGSKSKFADIYSELALNQAALRAFTKPLFTWKKALGQSHDGLTLYRFCQMHLLESETDSPTIDEPPIYLSRR